MAIFLLSNHSCEKLKAKARLWTRSNEFNIKAAMFLLQLEFMAPPPITSCSNHPLHATAHGAHSEQIAPVLVT